MAVLPFSGELDDVFVAVCVPVAGTGSEMLALMMCTSAFGWLEFISDWMKLR